MSKKKIAALEGDLFMTGNEVKTMIHDKGVKLWEVGRALGMNDSNFSRRLRKPFSPAEVERITEITNNLAASRTMSRPNAAELREFCIRHNYFTAGDNRQYEKLFELYEKNEPMHDIALVIWICSETDKRPAEIGLELLREVYLNAEAET